MHHRCNNPDLSQLHVGLHFGANRCSGSYWELIQRSLSFNSHSILAGVITIAIGSQTKNITETWKDLGPVPICLSFGSFIIFHHIIQSECCPSWEAEVMKKLNGLDYGSGMAHSFFHGYLKLILPANGDNLQGIAHRIIKYMEMEQIREEDFPIKKLIVLIPRSGNLFALLSDEPSQVGGDPDITYAEKLQDHLRDRAGTKARVYRGGAYRLRVRTAGGKTLILYTVAEGATPVKTFREACSAGSLEAVHLKQHRDDIVSNFYLTLNKLITDDPELRHLVDLLYYDDVQSQVDVISLLKDHLLEARYKNF
ncbi:Stimulator of interferon genes protein [Frankliniella fusca]|uniref:Stimulator of interferon genes protein n=1 Tax=Frankliniella fusca TaxID=407009 RepID=A0AAE1HT37_9NEOP|nr:Stimulator of interferon genes protein [Frankliniella fusca]